MKLTEIMNFMLNIDQLEVNSDLIVSDEGEK